VYIKCYSCALIDTYWKTEKPSKHHSVSYLRTWNTFQFYLKIIYGVMQIINAAKSRRRDVDKCSLQIPNTRKPVCQQVLQIHKMLKYVLGFFGLDSTLPRVGCIFVLLQGFWITSLKIRRQTRLFLERVGLSRCVLHCLGNCTAVSGCQYSHVRRNVNRFFFSQHTDKELGTEIEKDYFVVRWCSFPKK